MPLRFLAPNYWPTWVGLGILRLLERLPYPWIVRVGHSIGWLARQLPLNYIRVARCNLRLCLPELSDAEREALLDRHFRELGVGLCEIAMSWWSSNARIGNLAQIEGLEHLRQALTQGHGAILLTAHFTTLEISARIINGVTPISFLYRAPKNALLAFMAERNRARLGHRAIDRDDVRGMLRALKDNCCVWYAPDQSYRRKGAEMVPFFGVPAATNVFTSRLARLSGAAVLLYSHERLPGARGYRVCISPVLTDFPGPSPIADTERFNGFIESWVRRTPAQYWWIHRRFKGLSCDYPNYYGKAARRPSTEPAI